jgi:alpha-amylase/alpha-mannosidase (GH57 family)
MHQPDYRDPVAGQTLLPWTYLHAVKDYGEMLKTAAEVEGARMTFNLVPTLVEQLDRYLDGSANDRWLNLARRDPAGLDSDDKHFLLSQFFSVHAERHILPHRRYRELARKKETAAADEFNDQELRDLQVWFLLAWAGHHLRREPLIQGLLIRGANFTETDKAGLFEIYDREVAGILELYRKLEQSGRIEISVTPYAHPILPLLCGTAVAREATPGMQLPAASFKHPEDAALQIRYGLQLVADRLGERPRGMWPSEGSVSEAAVPLLAEAGALWAATDEGILARSLPGGLRNRSQLYRPYSYAGLPLLFRDLELSDRIGFVYAHWDPQRAAADLIGHLQRAAKDAPGGILPLILDGENCWERYTDNGYPFLRALYEGIVANKDLCLTTVSEALEFCSPIPLQKLAAGSWINSDFHIWIGHPEENTAWDWLERARRDTLAQGENETLPEVAVGSTPPEAILHLLRAEGSDWFWWFGDDHSTDQADIFDLLFRRHLEALYRSCGRPVPGYLSQPIKPAPEIRRLKEPSALFTPTINGRSGDYFEWLAAGHADLSGGGAMHAQHHEFSTLLYGYDLKNLYLRLDPTEDLGNLLGREGRLEVRLSAHQSWIARFEPIRQKLTLHLEGSARIAARGKGAAQQVVELAIPLAPIDLSAGDTLLLTLHLFGKEGELARWPAEAPLEIPYRGALLEAEEWFV